MEYEYDRTTEGEIEEDVDVTSGFGESTYGALAESFHGVYYLLFSDLDWTERFNKRLSAANLSTGPDLWLSGAFAIGFLAGGITTIILVLLALGGVLPVPVPSVDLSFLPRSASFEALVSSIGQILGVLLYAGIGAFIGVIIGGGVAVLYPYLSARHRGRQIGLVLPDGVYFMHALAVSGMNEMEVFEAVANEEDSYGEFAVEMKRITYKVAHLNKDFKTAVRDVAENTPNEDLRQFLVGMLSTMGSGGDFISYLKTQKQEQRRSRERQLESVADYVSLFSELYTGGILAPMLLVFILIIMALVGEPNMAMLLIMVYAVIPLLNILFGIMISSVKIDEVGDGYIRAADGSIPGRESDRPFTPDTELEYLDEADIFQHIYRKEAESRFLNYVVKNPFSFFKDHPRYVVFLTVPFTLLGWGFLASIGDLAFTRSGFIEQPLTQSVYWLYWPVISIVAPYALLFELKERERQGILNFLSDDFRSLAEFQNNGMTLPEAMQEVAIYSDSKLADEFGTMYSKLQMRKTMDTSLLEFANKYHIPELSRQITILRQAQAVSSQIGEVLTTAAETAEYQQEAIEDRLSKMRIQFVIIEGVFLIFILIMAGMDAFLIDFAKTQLSETGELFGSDGGDGLSSSFFTLIFIHAAFLQGFFGGMLGGYVRSDSLESGLKWAILNVMIVLGIWSALPLIEPLANSIM
jgi:flagellar protein FlaJ